MNIYPPPPNIMLFICIFLVTSEQEYIKKKLTLSYINFQGTANIAERYGFSLYQSVFHGKQEFYIWKYVRFLFSFSFVWDYLYLL